MQVTLRRVCRKNTVAPPSTTSDWCQQVASEPCGSYLQYSSGCGMDVVASPRLEGPTVRQVVAPAMCGSTVGGIGGRVGGIMERGRWREEDSPFMCSFIHSRCCYHITSIIIIIGLVPLITPPSPIFPFPTCNEPHMAVK